MKTLHEIPREKPSFSEFMIKGFETLYFLNYTKFRRRTPTRYDVVSHTGTWISDVDIEVWGQLYYPEYKIEAFETNRPWPSFNPAWIVTEQGD